MQRAIILIMLAIVRLSFSVPEHGNPHVGGTGHGNTGNPGNNQEDPVSQNEFAVSQVSGMYVKHIISMRQ